MLRKLFPFLILSGITLLLSVTFYRLAHALPCAQDSATYVTCIPVVQVGVQAASQAVAASDPANPFALIRKQGPTYAGTGQTAAYQIQLANFEAVTRTVQVTETIPDNLELIAASMSPGLSYQPETRQLSWQGEAPPARLEYIQLPEGLSLPYIDLAAYGVADLCAGLPDCDETAVTFNLGLNQHKFFYYGAMLTEITVSPNGLLLAADPVGGVNQNRWLPEDSQMAILAGLWRDVDMGAPDAPETNSVPTSRGRWHVALLSGLLAGQDLFYAQWHDAAAAGDPDNTARHAVALALGGGPYAGHIFYIYDNIAHPEQLVTAGYTIGLSDASGARGLTHAFSDCCGDRMPRGYPPSAGATLHLAPFVYYPESSQTTLTYTAIVHAAVPETVVTTVVAASDSPDPDNQISWSTHYLFVRRLLYLPTIQGGNGS